MPNKPLIYIADHDPSAVITYEAVLEGEDFEISFFDSGSSVLLALRERIPDLLIFDMVLPDLNGFELCQQIRLDENLRDLPILIMTIAFTIAQEHHNFLSGATVLMPKPFNRKVFLAQVHTLTSLNKGVAA